MRKFLVDGTDHVLGIPGIRDLFPNLRNSSLWDADYLHEKGIVEIFGDGEDDAPPDVEWWQDLAAGWSKLPGAWTRTWTAQAKPLAEVKALRSSFIAAQYEAAKLAPVSTAIPPAQWKGGFESAQGIKGALDMAEEMGLEGLVLYDVSSNEHLCSLAEARAIALAVGIAYQEVYGRKAARMRAIAEAGTVEAVIAVEW